ncbi:MAG: ABC transporter ATP-binding protein [Limnochordia bacterium]|jgi:ABC-2 type transport system ATP-binding protein|nr:ABC transporter ATP-binding protein [Limnochordia bacterium]MDD2628780.1 ABC transporter ATP-binding protein [Limnochordia bacterium]MDD4518491.1 ABC transporter ATP-binding protein [Limnochordia bacterium]
MIIADGLTKKYGSLTACDQVSLHVHAGELFGFLGPNGAGKTTTIKMLTGLLTPTSGSAIIAGINVQEQPVMAKGQMAFVPDSPNIYDKLTAREFLQFAAQLRKIEQAEATRRIEEYLDLFELSDRADELCGGFSHGMKQKVCLSAALLGQPKVLFLDEPTVGLDPKSARLIKDILRDFTNTGGTVFMSTHILEIAEQMCDRVGIIQAGKLIALGSIDELREGAQHVETGKPISLEDLFLELTSNNNEE